MYLIWQVTLMGVPTIVTKHFMSKLVRTKIVHLHSSLYTGVMVINLIIIVNCHTGYFYSIIMYKTLDFWHLCKKNIHFVHFVHTKLGEWKMSGKWPSIKVKLPWSLHNIKFTKYMKFTKFPINAKIQEIVQTS